MSRPTTTDIALTPEQTALLYGLVHQVANGTAPEPERVADLSGEKIDLPGCDHLGIFLTGSTIPPTKTHVLVLDLQQVDREALAGLDKVFELLGFQAIALAETEGDSDGHVYMIASREDCAVAATGYFPEYCDDEADAELKLQFNFRPKAERVDDDAAWVEWANDVVLEGLSGSLRTLPQSQRVTLANRLDQLAQIAREAA